MSGVSEIGEKSVHFVLRKKSRVGVELGSRGAVARFDDSTHRHSPTKVPRG